MLVADLDADFDAPVDDKAATQVHVSASAPCVTSERLHHVGAFVSQGECSEMQSQAQAQSIEPMLCGYETTLQD